MLFLRRIYCHYCGARSAHRKSGGTREFQCTSCEAWNFLDKNGEIMDTPPEAVTGGVSAGQQARSSFETFARPVSTNLDHHRESAFCSTCERNQRIYMETLSNYLPDEDHPQYHEYEKALPKFTADLEKRYPQICKRCAPQAQLKINRADHHAGAQNVAHLSRSRTRQSRARARDSWDKRVIRMGLDVVGMMVHITVAIQIVWHIYAICNRFLNRESLHEIDPGTNMTGHCVKEALQLRFHDSCEEAIRQLLPSQFLTALCLSWYNPGIRSWYHHTNRVERVKGQTQYVFLRGILLLSRAYGWYKISDPLFTEAMSKEQVVGLHGAIAFGIIIGEFVAARLVRPVIYQHRFKITPLPHERDIFASVAGPEAEHSTPHASSLHPNKLFAKDDPRPFPIWNLAPNPQQAASARYPSPPMSNAMAEDDVVEDAMDIDWRSSQYDGVQNTSFSGSWNARGSQEQTINLRKQGGWRHETAQSSGWEAMRNETFRIQSQTAAEAARKQKELELRSRPVFQPNPEPSPFRGSLPPAPMSMERRLRNPVPQVQFNPVPVSKQQDFMKQMRDGIEKGKNFTSTRTNTSTRFFDNKLHDAGHDDDHDSTFSSPAKSRTRGNLDLKKSSWDLPPEKGSATGLEDLFGGNSFSIADEPAISFRSQEDKVDHRAVLRRCAVAAVPIVLLVLAWNIRPVRRWICLSLVDMIDAAGL